MNENAKEWLTALRSGKYKKTTRQLRFENGYCCLGVACGLYAKKRPGLKWRKCSDGCFRFLGNQLFLPIEVQDWLGLKFINGRFFDRGEVYTLRKKKKGFTSLSDINDALNDQGSSLFSFNEIADIIEENESLLFRIDRSILKGGKK